MTRQDRVISLPGAGCSVTSLRDPCNHFAVVLNHCNLDSTGAWHEEYTYRVFCLWISYSPCRYRSASSLLFKAGSTNVFLPQVTSQSKNEWPPWNHNDRTHRSAIPIAFCLLVMICFSIIAEMISILQFTVSRLKSCPSILQPGSLCLYHYVLECYLII